MSEKKYVMIPFENAEDASLFYTDPGSLPDTSRSGLRLLDADEYPTKRYNGWTNYETWAVKLWMDNEESSYNYWKEAAQEAWNNATPGEYDWQTREQQAGYALSERLKDEHEDAAQTCKDRFCDGSLYISGAGVFSDLLNAALSEVNWSEIAESLLDDVDKTEAEEVSE